MDRTPAAPSRGELSGSDPGSNSGRDGEEQLHSTDATASVIAIPIEGGKTGFVSFPRSGNSYLRGLVERATGFQTSSVYCDRGLARTFLGECNTELNFFVKPHYPVLPRKIKPEEEALFKDYWKQFDQLVHVVRNPFDAITSWWHHSHAPRTSEGYSDHEAKLDIGKFGDEDRETILDSAQRWRRHAIYWQQAPVRTQTLRYEDLKAEPISHPLPEEDLPPLADIACIAEHDEHLQAYQSRRSSDFATWDSYEDDLRREVLEIVRRPFCSFGYHHVLSNVR
ncbi:hypothetical protein JCM16303_004449, partial [Sporobolomyces ruberrimus]